jgi:hypothetical protein
MNSGYIYCFSNDSMPGIFKIGMTERNPCERLKEANTPDTWRPPTQYKIELFKKVNNLKQNETRIHSFFSNYRINPKREFFRVSIEKIKYIFGAIEDYVVNEVKTQENPNQNSEVKTQQPNKTQTVKKLIIKRSPIFNIRKNKFENYEHVETGFVFNRETKRVIGKQNLDGTINELTDIDILTCQKYKFQYEVNWQTYIGNGFRFVKTKLTKEQTQELLPLGKKDDDICIMCSELCAGKGYSDRYEAAQGYYENQERNEDNQVLFYFCDICVNKYNIREGELTGLLLPNGKKFIIDSMFRMND